MTEQETDQTPQKTPDEMLEDGPEGFNPRDFGWALVIEEADVTRNEKLRELIEEWRSGIPDDPYRRAIYQKRNNQRLQCARELAELIEDD